MNTKYKQVFYPVKCVLEIEMSKNQDQILCIHIEENKNFNLSVIQGGFKNKIFDILMRENSEFKIIHSSIGQ